MCFPMCPSPTSHTFARELVSNVLELVPLLQFLISTVLLFGSGLVAIIRLANRLYRLDQAVLAMRESHDRMGVEVGYYKERIRQIENFLAKSTSFTIRDLPEGMDF